MKKDLISIVDIKDELEEIIDLGLEMKRRQRMVEVYEPLKDKSMAMIFEKPSTRTRVSFEVAMTQLGGHALYLSPRDMQLGRGETIADTARVLSRYVDAIVYRAYKHENVVELAENASVPVINALDDLEHPCQIVADLMTIKEKKGGFRGLKLAYVGDGNNVAHSLMLGAAIVGMNFYMACPDGYEPKKDIVGEARKIANETGAKIVITHDPVEAVKDADVIYTDVWVSMGDEAEKEIRLKVFKPYQVNEELVRHAKSNYIFMHCLPAHRGYEVTDDVIDSRNSVVFDEAENRLHAQKAILVRLIKP
ncbi:ornithine carbamoyltransferase [Candidatus Aciduliprofundum boonei]|uniref:Ornithine carbamoyltransferase n=1 Tax=Aciduliprofundum boonei (strain DSM 19572 / T469) TaxID=439481 RepID=D3TBN5_ACIB4|nr:ornithine carbamoyltransferase [Candidatus Aciduliprofundum boonei]ADD07970.1 ornithine carbamoyltransferase [Aciduliprofundum boonei T469]HII55161.1 ornithine carbamoyltransferase [Candidatus Aciduliprofundum boonei]